ncbi:MAG: hypothetical protein KJ643_26805 [Gammaproteobacteria bacterium]|nr:hypothetical protein [Gammaproteobacteria bacterium]MBU1807023.1 hypothetical protein [Gammaproteobacteria bacterium]
MDCTLYYEGRDGLTASRVVLEQLKYSAANPKSNWSVARLIGGTRRERSVIARLAKAWKGLAETRDQSQTEAALVSNQKIDAEVISAFATLASKKIEIPKTKPRTTASAYKRLAYAIGLTAEELQSFAAAIRFEGGAGSRFALEEQVLGAIASWTDDEIQYVSTRLRQYIRQQMRPEFAGELITRESLLMHFGVSDGAALFPCPSEISRVEKPVSRAPVWQAADQINAGVKQLCLHGTGGVGKTTALQEIEDRLPAGSIMIKYDCYGGGRYLDPSALRHRPADAFLQLTNELAIRLRLPLLLSRHHGSDYPRLFAGRLQFAASAIAAQQSDALIVIAIDAADNAVTAAQSRTPTEACFVHDFLGLTELPDNVRFIITARTGRLDHLQLPAHYHRIEVLPFSRTETAANVRRLRSAPDTWIDDFHHLSSGVPRVQTYAFEATDGDITAVLERLRPSGKSLDDVFRQQFRDALAKSGKSTDVTKLCAGLIALPRPVPISDLSGVLESPEALLLDICVDLAPGIRVQRNTVSFADEDFEDFVRTESSSHLQEIQQSAATWLLSHAQSDQYAAINIASVLFAADRGAELLSLVEREPAPLAVSDPVLRRDAELQRLRLAIKVSREAGDVSQALRFILIGAEGINTEATLRDLLVSNPDMAANFAQQIVGRLILSDPKLIEHHGSLLFHKLSVDADLKDAISVREGKRLLRAWMNARMHAHESSARQNKRHWKLTTEDVSSSVEAALKLDGAVSAIETLKAWTPKRIALEVAISLPPRLIAEGDEKLVESVSSSGEIGPVGRLFLTIPLSLAGFPAEVDALSNSLRVISRRALRLETFFEAYQESTSTHGHVLDYVLTACEILASDENSHELIASVLQKFLKPQFRTVDRRREYESCKLDLLYRAHALREAISGRYPTDKDVFVPRPKMEEKNSTRRSSHSAEQDRALLEVTKTVFDVYAVVADALVNRRSESELHTRLRQAVSRLKTESWRDSRLSDIKRLRSYTGKHLLVLVVAGYSSVELMKFATEIQTGWRQGNSSPNEQLISRLSLRQELHGELLADLAAAAQETLQMRIGAEEKTKALVDYARLIKPISPPDANEIFNYAVEAASELDREVVYQIRLLEKLTRRGANSFSSPRDTAKKIADIVVDAAIRLDGFDYFPWEQAMASLVQLDTPLALANAARWDDESIVNIEQTLPSILKAALRHGSLRPSQAASLALLFDNNYGILIDALELSSAGNISDLSSLAEEAAQDVLFRHRQLQDSRLTYFANKHGIRGRWTKALGRQDQFVSSLPPDPPREIATPETKYDPVKTVSSEVSWDRNTLLDSSQLKLAIEGLQAAGRATRQYINAAEILSRIKDQVAPRDRVIFLAALADIDGPSLKGDAVKSLITAIEAWWGYPAIQSWSRKHLPELIVKHLPEFSRFIQVENDDLTAALRLTGLNPPDQQNLILQGIETHVDEFDSEHIFALASLVGDQLIEPEAALLADWYAARLAQRISINDRDQRLENQLLPQGIDEAIARFLFAYFGDVDIRMRWRAAHAARRLARTQDIGSLGALINQYERRGDPAFRSDGLTFYWIAARLWLVIAFERISKEQPKLIEAGAATLLDIALDDEFPHFLVRSFARDACENLVSAGQLALPPELAARLANVNQTNLARSPADKSKKRYISERNEGRRFRFDSLDSIPYWYRPMLNTFADVGGDEFLELIEHWIVDIWGYQDDVRVTEAERRRGKFNERSWSLSSNRHGAIPTLERLNNHLEWHGMWCAVGELIKTRPLIAGDPDGFDDWNDLYAKARRHKLLEPPLWSADLQSPVPLIERYWQVDHLPLHEWVLAVHESHHREQLFASDRPDYIVVDSYAERRMRDRIEAVRISSALVAPTTAGALLRALQTMDDAWDYKLPEEGENMEIDQGPYHLIGWLQHSVRDSGIDDNDPLRGYTSVISCQPGFRVADACSLTREDSRQICWSANSSQPPMFIYESWGDRADDDERYTKLIATCGTRLLVHRDQLQQFLCSEEHDLIVEVEVTRRGRESGQYLGEEEEKNPDEQFDRLYRLDSRGSLEIAEGHLGSWSGDSAGA